MKFVLLFIALGNPGFMGEFDSERACQAAIREILVKRILGPSVAETQLTAQSVDARLQTQREFVCVPKG